MKLNKSALFLGLVIALVLTRLKFVGTSHYLPDATLAVFFVGGMYLRNPFFVPLLFLITGVMDYVSIENGVSNWCVTPAYGFLLPTYWVMWMGGKKFTDLKLTSGKFAPLANTLLVVSTLAFLISSGSFYLLSGYYEGSQILEKFLSAYQYYPGYLMNPFCYVSVACLIVNSERLNRLFRNSRLSAP